MESSLQQNTSCYPAIKRDKKKVFAPSPSPPYDLQYSVEEVKNLRKIVLKSRNVFLDKLKEISDQIRRLERVVHQAAQGNGNATANHTAAAETAVAETAVKNNDMFAAEQRNARNNTVQFTQMTGERLRLLQVNCRSIMNKEIQFWNIIDTCDPDIVIGTESWLTSDVDSGKIFPSNYTIFRRDRWERGGGIFVCVKSYINASLKWKDHYLEMLGVDIQISSKSLEVIACYRAPNENFAVLEAIRDRTKERGNTIVVAAGDLNLRDVDWKGVSCERKAQQLVNELVWNNGLVQVVNKPTRGTAILDVYLIRPQEICFVCDTLPGISDHNAVLLDLKICGRNKCIADTCFVYDNLDFPESTT